MLDAIFTEESIEFYSNQMKKHYMPPQIKMFLKRQRHPSENMGKGQRRYFRVGTKDMVLPNSYEPEKWIRSPREEMALVVRDLAVPMPVVKQPPD